MRHDPLRLDRSAYKFAIEIEPRFGDLDPNSHLNNVALAQYYEEGRVRFIRHLRDRHPSIGATNFVVARVEIDYIGESHYPAVATIGVGVTKVGTSSFRYAMALFQSGACLGLCETVIVYRQGGGPAPLSEALRAVLGEYALQP